MSGANARCTKVDTPGSLGTTVVVVGVSVV